MKVPYREMKVITKFKLIAFILSLAVIGMTVIGCASDLDGETTDHSANNSSSISTSDEALTNESAELPTSVTDETLKNESDEPPTSVTDEALTNESDEQITSDPNEQITSAPDSNGKTPIEEPLPSQSIEIQGLEILNEMREMLSCDDEMRLAQYVQSVSDCGIQSKDDLFAFVKIIDSLPQIPILDGNITWICFSHSISEDTGKETTVVYVTTEAANGNWTRVEYVLSVTDISQKILEEKASIGEGSALASPVKSADGILTLHMETRSPHPSGNGTMIQWIGEADGIFTRIYYFTNDSDAVETESLFQNIQITK